MQLELKIIIVLFLCTIFHIPVVQANEKIVQSTRNISAADWQKLTSAKSFAYKNEVENQQVKNDTVTPLLQKMILFIEAMFASPLLWIVAGIVAIFIVYKLLVNKDSILFGRRKKKMADGAEPGDEEDISDTNWDLLLQKAVQGNDLQLAVRYSYMWLLQLLQEDGLIKYRTDKTNFEYYIELNETPFKQPFKQLSRQYEYTHYGNYDISATSYNAYIDIFNKVKQQLTK